MKTVQLEFSEEDRKLFAKEARLEGTTLSEWLSWAAHARIKAKYGVRRKPRKPMTPEELKEFDATREAFWAAHSNLDGPEREPDWEEHLRVINERFDRALAAVSP